jgi:hypothetical protein
MDPYLHTIIALGCMAGCYYAGHYFAAKKSFKPLVEGLLDRLEADGFIYTTTDKDGEKELITISEVIAKTLRDSIKSSK